MSGIKGFISSLNNKIIKTLTRYYLSERLFEKILVHLEFLGGKVKTRLCLKSQASCIWDKECIRLQTLLYRLKREQIRGLLATSSVIFFCNIYAAFHNHSKDTKVSTCSDSVPVSYSSHRQQSVQGPFWSPEDSSFSICPATD